MSMLQLLAVAGDPVYLPDETRRLVQPRCDCMPKTWVCLTCKQPLANRYHLEAHVSRGIHVVARICAEHGPEELGAQELEAVRDA